MRWLLFTRWERLSFLMKSSLPQPAWAYMRLVSTLVCLLSLLSVSTAKNPEWLFQSEDKWDQQWKRGNWAYMDQVPVERAKVAVLAELAQLYGHTNFTTQGAINGGEGGGILDVGCGEGSMLDFLSREDRKAYVGIDISREAIHAARTKRPQGRFLHAMAHSFVPRRPGAKFRLIIFSDVLYYIDHESTLQRYNDELLTDDGLVIISIFQKPETDKVLYENIFESARKIFDKQDEMHLSGTTQKTAHGSDVVTAKTGFRIEVFRKKMKGR